MHNFDQTKKWSVKDWTEDVLLFEIASTMMIKSVHFEQHLRLFRLDNATNACCR